MDVIINVEKTHKVPTKLQIEDSNFSLQYSLADPFIIQTTPAISEPEYDITFEVNSEFIMRFAKAKGALGANTKEIFRMSTAVNDEGNKIVKIILGEPTSHSNKVEFTTEASFNEMHIGYLSFNSAYVKEILNASKDDLVEAKGYISTQGLLKLELTTETGKAIYYLPEVQIS